MRFRDRRDAGQRLAAALGGLRDENVVVLALPRGGVPVAAEIATELRAPLDVLLVRKIGVPTQPEVAMGAVVEGDDPIVVRNEQVIRLSWVSADEFRNELRRQVAEIARRRQRYRTGPPLDCAGRTVVLVDDGIATGATMRAAIRGLRQRKPKRLVVAVPVAPPSVLAELGNEADAVICLTQPSDFAAIGLFYNDFRQTEDEEVVALLDASRRALAGSNKRPGKEDLSGS